MTLKVLSLFDGISGAQVALRRLGIKPDKYYACEIDPHAIAVTQANFPDTVQLGDFLDLDLDLLHHIDMIVAGPPCQPFSLANQYAPYNAGDVNQGPNETANLMFRTMRLIRHFVDVRHEVRAWGDHNHMANFIVENVPMRPDNLKAINRICRDAVPFEIDSAAFTAQRRKRLYWFNVHIPYRSRHIVQEPSRQVVADILDDPKDPRWDMSPAGIAYMESKTKQGQPRFTKHQSYIDGKAATLTANCSKGVPMRALWSERRMFSPEECERLQSFDTGYTDVGISNTARFRLIGNAMTPAVIAWIMSFIKFPDDT